MSNATSRARILYFLVYTVVCYICCCCCCCKSLQSCPTLCDPTDGSPPGSTVPGTLQARTLEWVAISFSNAWKWKVRVKSLSRVWLCVTPWTAALQAPLSMGFPKQECWNGLSFQCESLSPLVMSNSLPTPSNIAHRFLCLWDSIGKNNGVDCHYSPGYLPDPGIKSGSPTL